MSLLIVSSGHNECHEFRFPIVRLAMSVSKVTSILDCFWHCHCLLCCHFLWLLSLFRIAFWRCSLNIFVFVIVFFFNRNWSPNVILGCAKAIAVNNSIYTWYKSPGQASNNRWLHFWPISSKFTLTLRSLLQRESKKKEKKNV